MGVKSWSSARNTAAQLFFSRVHFQCELKSYECMFLAVMWACKAFVKLSVNVVLLDVLLGVCVVRYDPYILFKLLNKWYARTLSKPQKKKNT